MMKKDKNIWRQVATRLSRERPDSDSLMDEEALRDGEEIWHKTQLKDDNFSPDVNAGWEQFQFKVRMRTPEQSTSFPWFRAAAAILMLLAVSFVIYQYIYPVENKLSGEIQVIAEKEVREIELPDGSKVWLNEGSHIAYSETFSIDNRKVKLTGEAFFEVVKMNGKRFTVLTETSKTEVLGTSFNVVARPGEPAKVQVATGKVAVTPKKSKATVVLNPGEEAEIAKNQDEKVVTKPIADQNYRAWQTKQLFFTNTNIPELAKTLEEYFDKSVQVDEALKNCRFTSSFKDPQLDEVLKVLALTGDFEITETKTGYRITGKPCKVEPPK